MRVVLAVLLGLSLAACAKSGDAGTSMSFNSGDGNTVAALDGKSGELKLDLPGFQGKVTLPKIQVNADNFDLNGVHLYPGSTISTLNIADGKGDGHVRVAFSSPAAPETVRDWLLERLNKQAGFAVSVQGSGLVGTTDEHKPFRLDLSPAGPARANGTITIGT